MSFMNNEQVISILKDLNNVAGVSGHEEKIGDKIGEYLKDCTDYQYTDNLGNRMFVKKGSNESFKLMISAHMDEIGFIVNDIWDDGYVSFLPVGMHDIRLIVNQVLIIHTDKGDVPGVVGAKPVHQGADADNTLTYADLKLDVGTSSRNETLALGIQPGDVITNERGSRVLNGKIFSGKAVDNRSGCAAMIIAMKLLKDIKTEATVYCCGTVQEELGVKGARPAATGIKPNIALCIDVCFGDVDGKINGNNNRNYLGRGPAIVLYDWSNKSCLGNIVPGKMKKALISAAEKADIPYQLDVTMNCGTDAAEVSLSNEGIVTGGIGIPNRYMHSAIGTVSVDDVRWTGELIASFIKGLKDKL